MRARGVYASCSPPNSPIARIRRRYRTRVGSAAKHGLTPRDGGGAVGAAAEFCVCRRGHSGLAGAEARDIFLLAVRSGEAAAHGFLLAWTRCKTYAGLCIFLKDQFKTAALCGTVGGDQKRKK
jgi:hypothetical protein